MSILFSCGDCGKSFKVDDRLAGKKARCTKCGNMLQVPQQRITPPPIPTSAPLNKPIAYQPVIRSKGILDGSSITALAALLIVGLIAVSLYVSTHRSTPTPLFFGPSGSSARGLPSQTAGQASTDEPDGTSQSRASDGGRAAAFSDAIFPERPAARSTAGGDIDLYTMTIGGTSAGLPMQIQLYLPAGRHVMHSLPCVFIAPAGTRLIHGSALGEGDTPEHLPYAEAGFAVLAYELSGDLPNTKGSVRLIDLQQPVRQFMAADGGLTNARAAIDYVLAKVPEVDPYRFYTAGHSSAATMALNLVAADHRFKAAAAYAPACDVEARWRTNLKTMNRLVPGTADLVTRVSPMRHIKDIACPILLFHADDDDNVDLSDNAAYATALQSAGKSIHFQRVASGGHYQSMIDEGIAAGIQFFIQHGARPLSPVQGQ